MKKLLYFFLIAISVQLLGQENLGYQKPSKEILDLVDVELAPSVRIDNNMEYMLLLYRDTYKSIAELSEEELRLGGLRINPKTNIGSRTSYYKDIKIRNIKKSSFDVIEIKGMPVSPRIANLSWSPNQKLVAFTNTTDVGVELWVVDIRKASAKKISTPSINANMKDVINWFEDSKSMIVKFISKDKKELIHKSEAIPLGPTISTSDGIKAQNRTYQDLLQDKMDEHNFEQLALSELYKVNIDGTKEEFLPAAMYGSISFSPDGEYLMINTIEKPFSYIVTYRRFPSKTVVYTKDSKAVQTVSEVGLIEDLPKGFMSVRQGKRRFSWRKDQPSSLTYVVALDKGDPAVKVDFRDEVFQLDAPFTSGKSIAKTINRYSGIIWGNKNTAILTDYWVNTRNTKVYVFNPSNNKLAPVKIVDRSYQDTYSDPGSFVTHKNKMGSYVLAINKGKVFLIGDGFSEKGQFPFVNQLDLKTNKTKRIYQSNYTDKVESIYTFIPKNKQILVRIESPDEFPNYYIRNLKKNKLNKITNFKNPFASIADIHKELITYKREDGLELSGTLYLPVGYDKVKKEKMPMILWAYPREYKDRSSASQKTSNPNKFTYPYYGSPVYWVSKGYVILADAAFPILGEDKEEPNDTFLPQLISNAKAAIDAVDKLGYIDRNRVAVGGHSYGAFMVANLLTHSDLFAAGIARSGAYNRTLTPFGFQSEERSYWDAPDVYNTMSPFMHSDKMKTPLLLIHGEADNNSGTYPMQSERYFNALKGFGAPVRLVILPKESHGYRAKESILHLLWEQDQWLDKYVKNKK